MKQAKKIFTRMCLNNWGGIDHKILNFNEYVNLFSGKSGSGKSTVMDAIQVILYGSLSSNFLNKAADDAKNRRSVLSYLRGEQKDGSANREGQDFCSVIALEIEDTGTHIVSCVGLVCEVHRNDTQLRKYQFFSHSGKIPEPGYITQEGYCYATADIKNLIKERAKSLENRGRVDVNRLYVSKEAYLSVLDDSILGYIDGARFVTMEKSAVALKMTNGTSQFIRDYMFPASASGTIEKISEQLGSYWEISEKVEDLKQRIELLGEVSEAGKNRNLIRADVIRAQAFLRCMEIRELESRIASGREELVRNQEQQEKQTCALSATRTEREANEKLLIQVSADLRASDLGSKEQHLADLRQRSHLLADSSKRWRSILNGLSRWEEDEYVRDYISNPTLDLIEGMRRGKVTDKEILAFQERIRVEKENIEEEYEDNNAKRRQIQKELTEKQELADAMKKGEKPYPAHLKKARAMVEERLSSIYRRRIPVYVLADLFDIRDEKWKNAVEGRMGRLKFSLVTEPQFAHDAAVVFRQLRQFENVDLINSDGIQKSEPKAMEHTLYEAVAAEERWVDTVLLRFLGHIVKCESVEELERVRDGVTPDCYSYSNFIFRHLKSEDYEKRACIGRKVSKSKLAEYEAEIRKLKMQHQELSRITEGLKRARQFESLNEDAENYVRIAKAQGQLDDLGKEMLELQRQIEELREGKYKELNARKTELESKKTEIIEREVKEQSELTLLAKKEGDLTREIADRTQMLSGKKEGYIENPEIEKEVEEALKTTFGQTLRNRKLSLISQLEEKEQAEIERLQNARNQFIKRYPSCGFNGMEKSNEGYDKLLLSYHNDYEPKYQEEFQKQCDIIYKSLRENVIATIHGDIKAAMRHKNEINRMLRRTNFSDSTYQIKIEPARTENGQFYEMLMAEELDSKNIDNDGFEGQLSLGEDTFFQKYEQKIQLLTEKFMPPRLDDDERQIERRKKELEQYADYRNYLNFSMYEQVVDENGMVIRENQVDDMAGRDSGGEGQNPKYVALLAGFAMLYMQQSNRDSKIKLVLLDEAFSKMDQERSEVCLKYARQMELQLIVCVPDERLQSLIQNVDCVYGFRRHANKISMMHIDKGTYLKMMEGETVEGKWKNN